MSSFNMQLAGMAPWRRAASIVLLVVAVAILVLSVTGVIHAAATIGAIVVVAGSYLVGPRSRLFKSEPA